MQDKINIKFFRSAAKNSVFQKPLIPSVVAIGNFDGLHPGHYRILEKVVSVARQHQLLATVITFEPLPVLFFKPELPILRLTSLTDKVREFFKIGIDQVVCLRFNQALAQLSAEAFVKEIVSQVLQTKHIVVGEDFRFGYQQQGDVERLEHLGTHYGFHVHRQRLVTTNEENTTRVSSTLIRQTLLSGNCERVQRLLGRPFSITKRVTYGNQRGKQWGIPTANCLFLPQTVLPKGVFVTQVSVENRKYWAVTNSGTRPSIGGGRHVVESHLLGFSGNLYGKRIKVEFFHKIRNEQYFEQFEQLLSRIQEDIHDAKQWIELKKVRAYTQTP